MVCGAALLRCGNSCLKGAASNPRLNFKRALRPLQATFNRPREAHASDPPGNLPKGILPPERYQKGSTHPGAVNLQSVGQSVSVSQVQHFALCRNVAVVVPQAQIKHLRLLKVSLQVSLQ